jgi:hypothetical protein
MKTLYVISIFIFLLHAPFLLYGQDHLFESGIIITKSDTLRGFLKRATDWNLTQSVDFKSAFDATEVKTFTPNSCLSFSFDIDKSTYNKVKIRYLKNEKPFSEERFGRMILKGVTTVYKLRLGEFEKSIIIENTARDLYIVLKKDTSYTLEIRETLLPDENLYNFKKTYLPILQHITRDCPKICSKAEDVRFIENEIVSYFNLYNKCVQPSEETTILSVKPKKIIGHGVEASASITPSGVLGLGYFMDIREPFLSARTHGTIGLDIRNTLVKNENSPTLILKIIGNYDLILKKNEQLYYGFGCNLWAELPSSKNEKSWNFGSHFNTNIGYRKHNLRLELAAEYLGLLWAEQRYFLLNFTTGWYLSKK